MTEENKAPPVDNEHVEEGAEQFASQENADTHQTEPPPVPPATTTASEVGVQHAHSRIDDLEHAFAGFLSHEMHNHPRVLGWLSSFHERNTPKPSTSDTTPPAETEIIPPSASPNEEQTGSSESSTPTPGSKTTAN